MTLTDLKPCPFCGATTLGAGSHDNGHGTVGHYVECGQCQNQGPWMLSAAAATESWNTRKSPWRSLKDDRPPIHSYVIVRGPVTKREYPPLAFRREGLGYATEMIGISVHLLIGSGFTEWMEVPE